MSRLVLIRHAQATLADDPGAAFRDYDRLSELGRRQADRLGLELARSDTVFTRAVVGPAVRHAQTLEAVAAAYGDRGVPWPEPVTTDAFGEHEGARVVERVLERGEDEAVARFREARAADPKGSRAYLGLFRSVTKRWVRGELPSSVDSGETWPAFRERVGSGVREVIDGAGPGETVAVFTSGGPIGSIVAWSLGLGDAAALDLAWVVENATTTELLFSEGRVTLKSFNTPPRLGPGELRTYV